MTLLYRTAEWHAFAKLRLHTESTLQHLKRLTTELGQLMRKFRDTTQSAFATFELPKESEARKRYCIWEEIQKFEPFHVQMARTRGLCSCYPSLRSNGWVLNPSR